MIVDPRRPMKYLLGHLSGAVNLPVYRAFGDDGALLDAAALGEWLGAGGVGEGVTPVLYDSPQGQNAAMLAWMMEYLGAPEVLLLDVFFERWKSEGREVAYRPVEPAKRRFTARPNQRLRATLDEVRANTTDRLVDFRSPRGVHRRARPRRPSRPYPARGQSRVARSQRRRGSAARSARATRTRKSRRPVSDTARRSSPIAAAGRAPRSATSRSRRRATTRGCSTARSRNGRAPACRSRNSRAVRAPIGTPPMR